MPTDIIGLLKLNTFVAVLSHFAVDTGGVELTLFATKAILKVLQEEYDALVAFKLTIKE